MTDEENPEQDAILRALQRFLDQPLGHYLDAVASGEPTPGGGSVGGVTAALGAALGEMVCNLTKPNPDAPEDTAAIEAARARLSNLRAVVSLLALEDEAAYGQYRAAAALPRASDAEKQQRGVAVQAALTMATDVPLRLAGSSLAIIETIETVARLGNRHALSDAMLGARLARGAISGAMLNVRGNAAMLKDEGAANAARAVADRIEPDADAALARVAATFSERS